MAAAVTPGKVAEEVAASLAEALSLLDRIPDFRREASEAVDLRWEVAAEVAELAAEKNSSLSPQIPPGLSRAGFRLQQI